MEKLWEIYYENGDTFSNLDGEPHEAPVYGVEYIWQKEPHDDLFNCHYYLWRLDYGCWINVRGDGLVDHLAVAVKEIAGFLAGRTIPGPNFSAIVNRVNREHGNTID